MNNSTSMKTTFFSENKYSSLNGDEVQWLKEIKLEKLKSVNSTLESIKEKCTKVTEAKAGKVSDIQIKRFDSTRANNIKIHLIGLEICSARRKMAEAKRMKEEDIKRFDEEEKKVKMEAEKNLEDLKNEEEMTEVMRNQLSQELKQINDECERKGYTSKKLTTISTDALPEDDIEPANVSEQFIEFIQDDIKNMEQELLCPVCLEVSEAPIITCPSQHNICGQCWNKMRSEDPFCPQCRKPIPYPPTSHRMLEKLCEQLKQSYAKLDKILSSQH